MVPIAFKVYVYVSVYPRSKLNNCATSYGSLIIGVPLKNTHFKFLASIINFLTPLALTPGLSF